MFKIESITTAFILSLLMSIIIWVGMWQENKRADAKARGWEGARNNEKASRAAGNSEGDSERK